MELITLRAHCERHSSWWEHNTWNETKAGLEARVEGKEMLCNNNNSWILIKPSFLSPSFLWAPSFWSSYFLPIIVCFSFFRFCSSLSLYTFHVSLVLLSVSLSSCLHSFLHFYFYLLMLWCFFFFSFSFSVSLIFLSSSDRSSVYMCVCARLCKCHLFHFAW